MSINYKFYNRLPIAVLANKIFSSWKVVVSFAMIIVSIGISVNLGDCLSMAFPRSGAALVCLAISCFYFNYLFETEIKRIVDTVSDTTRWNNASRYFTENFYSESDFDDEEKLPEELRLVYVDIKNSNPGIEFDEAMSFIEYFANWRHNEQINIETLEIARINLLRLELVLGFIGTLIWGFGDIFIAPII